MQTDRAKDLNKAERASKFKIKNSTLSIILKRLQLSLGNTTTKSCLTKITKQNYSQAKTKRISSWSALTNQKHKDPLKLMKLTDLSLVQCPRDFGCKDKAYWNKFITSPTSVLRKCLSTHGNASQSSFQSMIQISLSKMSLTCRFYSSS